MLFTTNTTSSAARHAIVLPLPLLILATFLCLASSAEALPTSNRRAAALFQPFFQPADPQVGPARSLERLRLRRSLASTARRTPVAAAIAEPVPSLPRNPKAKRSETPSSGNVLRNPKKKRSPAPATIVPVVANPKSKRSLIVSGPVAPRNPKAKRSLVIESSTVLRNPKNKRSLPLEQPRNPKAKRSAVVTPLVLANPKSKRSQVQVLEQDPVISIAAQTLPTARRNAFLSLVRRLLAGEQVAERTIPALAKRQTTTTAPRAFRIIANPKNVSPSSSSCVTTVTVDGSTSPASSQTARPTSATSTKAATSATSTAKPTTTVKPAATTTAAATSKTSTSVKPSATAGSWPSSGGLVAGGYYADWNYETLPVANINFDMYDLINYSFAVPTSTFDVQFIGWNSDSLIRDLVTRAHAKNTKVLIAIGGWSDSEYFSQACATANNRRTFVANILKMVNKYNVDGVDIDWEYPGGPGDTSNNYMKSDTANFLLFLQDLRAALGAKKHISSCATQRAFIGSNGSPVADVSAFAAVLDNVLVMNYDVWGASSYPGANAPLKDNCANSNQPNANMQSAIDAWEKAGMPASKILMGVPAYGYVSSSTATSLVHKRDSIPSAPMSNRERASLAHAEELKAAGAAEQKYVSPFKVAYQKGHAEAEARRKAKRALKRTERRRIAAAPESDLAKRQDSSTASSSGVVYCPNNHSGKPCAGVQGQNITEIDWNPLDDLRNGTGNGTTTGGVFTGNVGKNKLGQGDLSGLEGNQIDFWKLINYGVLVQDGNTFNPVNGYTRSWDACSETPFLYDTSRKVVITYDDPASMSKKGRLALQRGIAGIMMWEMSGDTTDLQLAQAWRSSMGLKRTG